MHSLNMLATTSKTTKMIGSALIALSVSGCMTDSSTPQAVTETPSNKGGVFGKQAAAPNVEKPAIEMPAVQMPILPNINSAGGSMSNGFFTETRVHGYRFSDAKIASLPVGSSREKVRLTLGAPSTTSTIGGESYYYISQVREQTTFLPPKVVDQKVLAVYFSGNKVSKVANYGIEDGKIINFLDRTTPTGGDETTFVKQLFNNLLSSPN